MHVLSTAGHVDHGKSSLILALTGTDPDRWPEEKERGLTIDLGFAHLMLPSGKELSLVDVPGHIRFIKNMLAGVGAIDGVIFVVAANEVWKPQSEEHLRILDLLGTKTGIIVIAKADLVDDEWLELATMEVQDHVRGTFLQNAPIVAVDSLSGRGLDDLIGEIEALLGATPPSADLNRPRLWIDRVFSSRGSGTVVTGTLTGGHIDIDQELAVFPSSGKTWNVKVANLNRAFLENLNDSSMKVRVRGLQSHGQKLQRADPGRRLALNLLGVSSEQLSRGDVLIDADQWCATSMFDATIKVLSNLSHGISKKGAYAIYIGSGDYLVKINVLGKSELEPGESGGIRVHLNSLVPLGRGDRFILRELGRQETVAGGEVVNINPKTSLGHASLSGNTSQILEENGFLDANLLYKMTGESVAPNLGGRFVISERLRAQKIKELLQRAKDAGQSGFEISELDEISRLLLQATPELTVDSSRVYSSEFGPVKQSLANHPYLKDLEKSLFKPPSPEGVDRQQIRELVRQGLIIECDGIYFSPRALEKAKEVIWRISKVSESGFTVSQLRDELDTSRKFLLALVGCLDAKGYTRRDGDYRKPGPALIREFSGN
ncbi:MAG: hypothetical protein EPN30_08225 [Actinomycetota bacterium]|nr:MAG: hypothetical protein EPN30_08225 [Actinomycetota bacterium]